MKKSIKLTAVFIAAAILAGCSTNNENGAESLTELTAYSAEPEVTDAPTDDTSSDTETDIPNGSLPASAVTSIVVGEITTAPVGNTAAPGGRDVTPSSATETAAPSESDSTNITAPSSTTVQNPSSQTGSGAVELIPNADSGETLVMRIDISKISKIKYSAEQVVESTLYTENSVILTKSAFKTELADAFDGLVYISVNSADKTAENNAYSEWKKENTTMKAVPETLTFLDKNGNELVRFTSDTYAALGSGDQTNPLVRAFVNGTEYELFYGDFDYNRIQYTLLSQMLVGKGFFTLDTYAEIAKTAVSSELSNFESQTPEYRVYSPDRALVLSDGTVKYPETFPDGTLLIDCTFGYSGGGIYVVTMNAANGSILQTEQRY